MLGTQQALGHDVDLLLLVGGFGGGELCAPKPGFSLDAYAPETGEPRLTGHEPVPVETCARYGQWFAEQLVPEVEDVRVLGVDRDTFIAVSNMEPVGRWLVPVIKLPGEPRRHRVAVWREPRRIGARSLGQGVWAVPDVPVFADGIARALELAEAAEGQAVTLNAFGRGPEDAGRLQALFTAARSEDWKEFLADCGKFEEELAKEIRIAKCTLAELEEEEQSLERLRRRHRDLTARDVFGAPEAAEAGKRLKDCAAACEDYAERVFAALHGTPEDDDR
ncbi:Chromate resistance protein ChrB [Streptomyces mirabilis]